MKIFLDFRKAIMEGPSAEGEALLPVLKQEIIDGVYMRMMGFGKSRYIIRQLHQLQKDSVLLLNVVYSTPQEQKTGVFYTLARQCLTEILESLQCYKCEYFNRQQAVPLYLVQEAGLLLDQKRLLLEAGMKKKKIDPELQAVVLYPFLSFGKKGYSSYQQMEYLLRQADELIAFNDGESLLRLLLRNGFNTLGFNHYYMLKISAEVYAEYQMAAQFDILFEYRKILEMMPKKSYRCYDPLAANTRGTLLKFVETELRYLNRKQEISAPKIAPVTAASSSYRIKTSLSVDALAYLLRLLVENGVIEASPKSELIAFMATYVQTCGSGEQSLSVHSLNTKYKQVTQFTAGRVRSLLVKMAKQAQDNFNL
jgi:hypothetical protein